MNIRPFDWRDITTLYRYRHQTVFLNSSLVLTRGPKLVTGALISYFTPSSGIFTSVCANNRDSDQVLIGQCTHTAGSPLAQLIFLVPDAALGTSDLPLLLEHLMIRMGERGSFRLLADVDERTTAYESLRRASFAVYSRQRIWQLKGQPVGQAAELSWRVATEQDVIAVRSLYHNVIPGLVQQVEPFPPAGGLRGMVYREREELLAYAELKYGLRGIWVQPFVHPDAEEVAAWLFDLLLNLPNRFSRPVYLCIRSYESWLEPALEALGAEAGPRQAMMVKHLAIPQKVVRTFVLPALEGGHPEVAAPIAQSEIAQTESN